MPCFKDNLALLRKRNKLTQNDLGALLGLSGSTISMYERGERMPSKEALELIADHFNVPIDFLLGRDTIDPPAADTSGLTPKQREALSLIESMSEEQLDSFLKLFNR